MNACLADDPQLHAPVSTTDLVRAAAAGDQAACEAIVARYSNLLWHVVRIRRLDDSEAADVVQTTWMRLVQHLQDIRQPEALAGWLATTASRESLRALRRADREQLCADASYWETAQQDEAGPEAQALAAETDRMLWRCVDQLSTHYRTLLRLLMADPPLSYQQISTMLNIPIGSIGPMRARALQRLRHIVQRTTTLAEISN